MSDALRTQILSHLGHNGYRPVRTRELEQQLRIREGQSADSAA